MNSNRSQSHETNIFNRCYVYVILCSFQISSDNVRYIASQNNFTTYFGYLCHPSLSWTTLNSGAITAFQILYINVAIHIQKQTKEQICIIKITSVPKQRVVQVDKLKHQSTIVRPSCPWGRDALLQL